jgi:hypothetical protein
MSAAKPEISWRTRRNPKRLDQVRVDPRCYVCGELAEYTCDWDVHIFPAVTVDDEDYRQTVLCENPVCYRHVREVDDGTHYCLAHWDQLNPVHRIEGLLHDDDFPGAR